MISCIVDCRVTEEEIINLSSLDLNILKCPKSKQLYEAISSHPDIQVFPLNKDTVIVQRDMDYSFIKSLEALNKKVILSSRELSYKYPHDIILNCLLLGDLFLHNLKYTDSTIIDSLPISIKRINTNQGYTKCSTAVINNNAVITSDISIAASLKDRGIDILFLAPGDILLEGFSHGFIGGCCGLLDEKNIAFFGSLEKYAHGKEVKDFLRKYKVDYHYLADSKLIDRGSLFTL